MDKLVSFVFLLFFVLSIRDVYQSFGQDKNEQPNAYNEADQFSGIKKKIPESNLNKIPTASTITIRYCYSCGYKKAFEDYKQILNERYPDIIVNGEHHQPPGLRMYLAQFLSVGKIVFIVMVLLNSWPTFLDQFISPAIKDWIFNHKLYACLMAFFLCNTFENGLLSTGAFEIEYNDILVWSKIKNGRILAPSELFAIIDGFSRDRYVGDLDRSSFIN